METRNAKIMFTKPGGTAGKGSLSSRISLPVTWIRAMGISEHERDVIIEFNNNQIIIKKPQ